MALSWGGVGSLTPSFSRPSRSLGWSPSKAAAGIRDISAGGGN